MTSIHSASITPPAPPAPARVGASRLSERARKGRVQLPSCSSRDTAKSGAKGKAPARGSRVVRGAWNELLL